MVKHLFSFSGVDRAGQKLKGQAVDVNADLLKLKLSKQGLCHIKVKRQFQFFRKGVRYRDITNFSRQVSVMQKSGLPLLKALEVFSSNPGPLQTTIEAVKREIEKGKTFSQGLRQFPQYFDALFCSMIEIAEISGILDEVLASLAEYRERLQRLRTALIKALAYPLIVLLVASSISIVLLIFIVPQFQSMFAEFNAPLPLSTQMLIHISYILKQQGVWMVLIFFGLLVTGSGLKKRSETVKRYWDKSLLSLPVLGKMIQKAMLVRLSSTLSLMLSAGMPLSQALQILSRHFENRPYQFAMTKCIQLLKNGQAFHQALGASPYFPKLLIQMVQVGEESGALESMLKKAALLYQEELDYAVGILKELLEPVLMVLLGLIVGGIVIAMYLPIFNLGGIM